MNEISLLTIELILCLTTIPIIYKKYKLEGMYAYSIANIILSCTMSLKTITIYDYDINLGIIPFVSVFIVSNIIIQKQGFEETKRHLLVTIAATIFSYLVIVLVSKISPSNIGLFTNASYDNIFSNSLRFIFANIVTLLYSLIINNKLYYYLKRMKNNILISNLFSTIIIQFISATLFSLIAYIFIKEPIDIIKIIMVRYLMSLIVGTIGTLSIYITKYIKE